MEEFNKAYRSLNDAQKRAVDTIDGPVLVIAGPGTGKTQLLSVRVANILRKTDVNPSNILCLTYTESGQAAMQQRLKQLIGRQAKKVEIHTFHGFGTYLITRFSEHFPELAGFRPADDLALYETLLACFEKLPRSNPLAKMAYGQFTYQADVSNRISQLKQAGITPKEALERAQIDLEWCKTTARKITKVFNEAGRLSPKSLTAMTGQLRELLDTAKLDGLALACIEDLRIATDEAEASSKTAPMSTFKKKWFSSEGGTLYFKPADQLKKIMALAEIYQAYEQELQRRKLFDYDDMILYALNKLEHNRELLAEVQETFQYIVADEYQDTNAAQARIITLIADNYVNEGRPNVMVVGDDDQAIYGFQGAMGDIMLHFRERWHEVVTITLKENYRSTQKIIDAARQVIVTGQNRLENYYEDIDKTLRANTSYTAIEPVLHNTTSPQAVLAHAVHTAQTIRKGSQLAIIATKHKYLRELADYLDAANVKYFYEGREDLLKDPELTKVILLAQVADAIKRNDFTATNFVLPELFATETLKVSRKSAWEIAVAARHAKQSWWQAMMENQNADTKQAAQILTTLAESIDPSSGLDSLKFIAEQLKIRATRKSQALVSHAAKYLAHENVTLHELLTYVRLCVQAGITLPQKVEKGNREAQVLLLTAHKSKGLEFDKVYVLHADHYTWFKEKGRRNNLTLPEGWNKIEPATETPDDRLRLLYVVLTRAKQELGLIRSNTSLGGRLNDPLPGLENLRMIEHEKATIEKYDLVQEQVWQAWYMPQNKAEQQVLKTLLKDILETYRLSPTHLTMFVDVPHGGPVTFLAHILLGIPTPIHPEALFGNYIHRCLSFVQEILNHTGKLPGAEEVRAYLEEQPTPLTKDQVTDIVEVMINYLHKNDVIKPGGVSEYSFSKENIKLLDLKLTGTTDHFLKSGDHLLITDFKTGRALNSWRVTEDYYKQKLHRFREQLLFYELLFRLSPKFQDITKFELRVSFVEPSRRDVYYDLPLDSDPKERQRLEDLMHAVWNHIQELNLPDITTYSLDATGITTFEDDLINGNI